MQTVLFTETEVAEQEWLRNALPDYELKFAPDLKAADGDAELLAVFVNSRIDAASLEKLPKVRLICTRSTTAEHIDLPACAKRGITVCNVPGYGDYTVAEHTFALILGLARRLREAMESHTRRTFSYEDVRGMELRGKTLGVIGAGRIGQHVIRMAAAFELKVIVHELRPDPQLAVSYVSLDELLASADIITLHASLTPETFHLFDRAAFAKCKPGVLIINTARGRLIETGALCEALDSGIVAGAGLDVLEESG